MYLMRQRVSQLLVLCLLIILGAAAPGCTGQGGAPPPSPVSGSDKVSVPIQADLTWRPEELAPGRPLTLTLRFVPLRQEAAIRLQWETRGAVSVGDQAERRWQDLPANQPVEVPVVATWNGEGPGELRARIEVLGADGQLRYGRTPNVWFLVTPEEVLAGPNGTWELRLLHLDHLRAMGKLTEEQYQAERQKVLNGGATTNP